MDKIPPPLPMDFSNRGTELITQKWRKWSLTMQLYLDLTIKSKSEVEKCKTFLYLIGEEGRDIFDTLTIEPDEQNKIEPLFKAFEAYCKPKVHKTYERFKFNKRDQREGEAMDVWITELKMMAKNCEYRDLENELIRDRIICGVCDTKLQERLLRADEMNLDKTIDACRQHETSQQQKELIQRRDEDREVKVDYVKQKTFECYKCGRQHGARQCPAFGHVCHKCGNENHFAEKCTVTGAYGGRYDKTSFRKKLDTENGKMKYKYGKKKKKIPQIQEETSSESDDDSESFFVTAIDNNAENDECYTTIQTNGINYKWKVDTGAQANIIPKKVRN